MANAADGTTTFISVAIPGIAVLDIRDGITSFEATTNFQPYTRQVIGEQGERVDNVFQNVTGSFTFARVNAGVDAFEEAYTALVVSRQPKIATITRTILYPATGEVVVKTYPGCRLESFAQPVDRNGELMSTYSFTSGSFPLTA